MRILQVCKKVPFPLSDGESIAVHALSKVYSDQGHYVDLLCMNTARHHRDMSLVLSELTHYQNIYHADVDNRITFSGLIQSIWSLHPYHVTRLESKAFEERLIETLSFDYDIIQLETIYPAMYLDCINKYSRAKIVIRTHNVEHLIWRRLANNTSFLKRWYLRLQSNRLARFEKSCIGKCDLLLTVSEDDLDRFVEMGYTGKSNVVPIGMEMEKYANDNQKKNNKQQVHLGFIGTLDWLPNETGLVWFLDEVWPEISSKYGGRITFNIAGRNIPDSVNKYASDQIRIHGEVESALDFMSQCDVMIVPLLAGSGQRVKILEAMALGVPVISTSIGVEGIPAVANQHILLANDPSSFLDHIEAILDGHLDLDALTLNAKELICHHFDAKKIVSDLLDKLSALV